MNINHLPDGRILIENNKTMKEVQDQIDIQERYESLIRTQGLLLAKLADLSLKASRSKGKEQKELKEFINKYQIGK